jgi:hypothetical protein
MTKVLNADYASDRPLLSAYDLVWEPRECNAEGVCRYVEPPVMAQHASEQPSRTMVLRLDRQGSLDVPRN